MKKVAVPLIVFGSGLAAFGIFGFQGQTDRLPAGWGIEDQFMIAIGVGLVIWGAILRKDSK
jgi:hypothetical protein